MKIEDIFTRSLRVARNGYAMRVMEEKGSVQGNLFVKSQSQKTRPQAARRLAT